VADAEARQYAMWAAIIAAVALILAPLDWPYGYYRILRVGVLVAGATILFLARPAQQWLVVALAVCMVAWNPPVPLGLSKDQWTPLNVIAAAVFALTAWKVGPRPAT
jgi:hypothetical protein